MYEARMNMDDKERSKLVFQEMKELQNILLKKTEKTKWKATAFQCINTILNLIIIASSLVATILTGIDDSKNIPVIVLTSFICAISTTNQLLKLGPRGYYYIQGNIRLRRILSQVRDIIYMYHTYTTEQVLTYLSSFRTEVDEIDLDLYKSSMTGEVKFSNNEIQLIDHSEPSRHSSDSHIHIHIDQGKDENDKENKDDRKKKFRSISLPSNNVREENEDKNLKRTDSAPVITNSPLWSRKSVKDLDEIV